MYYNNAYSRALLAAAVPKLCHWVQISEENDYDKREMKGHQKHDRILSPLETNRRQAALAPCSGKFIPGSGS